MKNLIIKIKYWLIKKLGGYTEQNAIYHKVEMRTHKITPVTLRTEIRVDPYMLSAVLSETNFYDRFKRELVYKLADKIVEENLATISCTDYIERCEQIYRAELCIIHPHDAAMSLYL